MSRSSSGDGVLVLTLDASGSPVRLVNLSAGAYADGGSGDDRRVRDVDTFWPRAR